MLEIKGVYKTFNPGTINEKKALNGIDLTLNKGDFVTVIGGNGLRRKRGYSACVPCGQIQRARQRKRVHCGLHKRRKNRKRLLPRS